MESGVKNIIIICEFDLPLLLNLTKINFVLYRLFVQDVPDSFIYRRLLVGVGDDPYYKGNIVNMLREVQEEGLFSQQQCQQYIGRSFRPKCAMQVKKLDCLFS